MESDPAKYQNPEMEIWLLTYLYYHNKARSVIARNLLEDMPKSLLRQLPTERHLHYMVTRFIRAGYFQESIGTFRAGSNYHLFISNLGILEFRKQIFSLFQLLSDENKIFSIIDKNVGNNDLRNTIKEFFRKNKGCNEDEFDFRLREFTGTLGKESVIWMFKLILASSEKTKNN